MYLLIIGDFDKLIYYAILTLAVSFVITLVYRRYCITHFSECKYKFSVDKEVISPMISFSGWNLFVDLAYQSQNSGINMILNLFFGTPINAAYGIGLQLSRVVNSFISSFTLAVKPQIIKYYSTGQIQEMESLMYSSTRYSFLMLYTLAMPVIMEADFILEFWLKNPPEHSAMFSRLFLVMMTLNVLWLNLTHATQATNRMKTASLATGSLYILIPIITYIIFKLGFRLIYLPMLIAICIYGFVIVVRLLIVKKLIPQISISTFCKDVLLISAITCIVGSFFPICINYLLDKGWPRMIITCIASILSMAGSVYYLAMEKTMRKKVKALVLRKLHIGEK